MVDRCRPAQRDRRRPQRGPVLGKSVLVIAAHPDDEILGPGGTLRRHAEDGDTVHAVIVCEGESIRYQGREVGLADHAGKAAEIIGFASIELLGFRDQHLDTLALTDLVTPLEKKLRETSPQVVYTHFYGDLNRDHQIVAEAASVATRPLETYIEEVLGFETASSTEWSPVQRFAPSHFVEISSTLDEKLRAMSCYPSEVRRSPHPRSLESLRSRASYWGSCVLVSAAEAFVVYRRIRRQTSRSAG
jgi:LmbE family N-acetylglucosaminyl deacetylase